MVVGSEMPTDGIGYAGVPDGNWDGHPVGNRLGVGYPVGYPVG